MPRLGGGSLGPARRPTGRSLILAILPLPCQRLADCVVRLVPAVLLVAVLLLASGGALGGAPPVRVIVVGLLGAGAQRVAPGRRGRIVRPLLRRGRPRRGSLGPRGGRGR